MSFAEILPELPKLTEAGRQEFREWPPILRLKSLLP